MNSTLPFPDYAIWQAARQMFLTYGDTARANSLSNAVQSQANGGVYNPPIIFPITYSAGNVTGTVKSILQSLGASIKYSAEVNACSTACIFGNIIAGAGGAAFNQNVVYRKADGTAITLWQTGVITLTQLWASPVVLYNEYTANTNSSSISGWVILIP